MKSYYIQHNVGRAKYLVSYCTGEKKHPDGSPFWDINIFTNKKYMNQFINQLQNQGYTYK